MPAGRLNGQQLTAEALNVILSGNQPGDAGVAAQQQQALQQQQQQQLSHQQFAAQHLQHRPHLQQAPDLALSLWGHSTPPAAPPLQLANPFLANSFQVA